VIGAAVIIAAAIDAGSVALAGFGLDSLIEIFASTIVVWQLKGVNQNRERLALRCIGVAFFLLALYVLVQSARSVVAGLDAANYSGTAPLSMAQHNDRSPSTELGITGWRPGTSAVGMAWLFATVVAMLLLAWGKQVTGRQLGNRVLQTEARVTLIDAWLAASVLLGVGLNAAFGWWWADPAAGLIIVYYGIREGREALRHRAELRNQY
jgi:divalent metal cation (Fe/Co/Zn/Cd) transporter